MVRRLALDALLDPSLVLRRDEGLATRSAQFRHLFLTHKLPDEARRHRYALAHPERVYLKISSRHLERSQARADCRN